MSINPLNAKLQRTLERFQSKIEAGDFYEAHQTLRTVANRYVRSKSYQEAIDLISEGSLSFLKAGQGGSGTDLIFYLLEVYELAQVEVDQTSVSRLVRLLLAMDVSEPNLRDVVTGMNNWSSKFSEFKFGDPSLHNVIGSKLVERGYGYEAERYLLLGTHDSLLKYVRLLWNWFKQCDGKDSAIITDFFSRLVFNYLFISNIAWAYEARDMFLQLFIDESHPQLEVIQKNGFKMFYFREQQFADLNFLQLLLLTCQTKNKELFLNLKGHYSGSNQKYANELEFLGQEYFGIVGQKRSNFLQDMMAGFLGGSGGA